MHKPGLKNLFFWFILVSIPFFFALILTLGWYAHGKLTYATYFCSKFSKIDNEVGWVHRPNVESCMGTHDWSSRGKFHHLVKIYTDGAGFRSSSKGENVKKNAVMFLGDSFTFSYMVSFGESFPAIFSKITNEEINNIGSPAYSAAQAIVLGARWLPKLKPKSIVYFETGFWDRGICIGKSRPKIILKPCYWVNPKGYAELVLPVPAYVEMMSNFGILPGGMVGAGENTWTYFLVSRPIAKLKQALVRLGFLSGFPHDFRFIGEDSTPFLKALVVDLVLLAKRAETKVILIDSVNIYGEIIKNLSAEDRWWLEFVSYDDWEKRVVEPSMGLPKELVRIPHDGHYGPAMNKLIAEEIARRFKFMNYTSNRPKN